MIEIKNLSAGYGDKKVFTNLNLKLEDGKITAILGENGSGKTTLTKLLLGLMQYGGEITGMPDRKSVVFQEDRLVKNLTAKENVKLVTGSENDELFGFFGLNGLKDKHIKELSGGERRKIALVRALSYSAPMLILDEPFSSVDIASKNKFMEYIRKENKNKKNTVIFITHDILEATYFSDRIIVIKNGEAVFDEKDFDRETVGKRIYGLLSNPD